MNRREFISTWVRYLLLILMGSVSAIALLKNRGKDNSDCLAGSQCGKCNKSAGCRLPQKS
jgi:hypothetical protein